jgi:hypothetical protein
MLATTFTPEQIQACIAHYKLTATSQFSAEQLAVKTLSYRGNPAVRGRGSGRRNHRSFVYGDCHWAGK